MDHCFGVGYQELLKADPVWFVPSSYALQEGQGNISFWNEKRRRKRKIRDLVNVHSTDVGGKGWPLELWESCTQHFMKQPKNSQIAAPNFEIMNLVGEPWFWRSYRIP